METWDQIPAFVNFASFVKNMPMTNDLSECLVRPTVMYANVGPKGESGFQAHLQLVDDAIERLPTRTRFSKKGLIAGHSK